MVSKFQVATACFSCSPPKVNSSELPLALGPRNYLTFQIISTFSNESWNQILPSLSQASTTHHLNVFISILSLSEGRASIAWVPSNKMFFLPLSDIKRLSLSPSCFFFTSTLLLSFLTMSLFSQLQRVKLVIWTSSRFETSSTRWQNIVGFYPSFTRRRK
jgi:hypothetical protein